MVNAGNPRREVSDFLFYKGLLNKKFIFVKTQHYANLYYANQNLYRT